MKKFTKYQTLISALIVPLHFAACKKAVIESQEDEAEISATAACGGNAAPCPQKGIAYSINQLLTSDIDTTFETVFVNQIDPRVGATIAKDDQVELVTSLAAGRQKVPWQFRFVGNFVQPRYES